ncbi:sentrin-specific protease 2 [Latimeria chalumnae]|uniref:sentrin-specific protease 2 n=1 Tax=Latimeria chalumnae TaxID=7897 RepID=UPI00313C8423
MNNFDLQRFSQSERPFRCWLCGRSSASLLWLLLKAGFAAEFVEEAARYLVVLPPSSVPARPGMYEWILNGISWLLESRSPAPASPALSAARGDGLPPGRGALKPGKRSYQSVQSNEESEWLQAKRRRLDDFTCKVKKILSGVAGLLKLSSPLRYKHVQSSVCNRSYCIESADQDSSWSIDPWSCSVAEPVTTGMELKLESHKASERKSKPLEHRFITYRCKTRIPVDKPRREVLDSHLAASSRIRHAPLQDNTKSVHLASSCCMTLPPVKSISAVKGQFQPHFSIQERLENEDKEQYRQLLQLVSNKYRKPPLPHRLASDTSATKWCRTLHSYSRGGSMQEAKTGPSSAGRFPSKAWKARQASYEVEREGAVWRNARLGKKEAERAAGLHVVKQTETEERKAEARPEQKARDRDLSGGQNEFTSWFSHHDAADHSSVMM